MRCARLKKEVPDLVLITDVCIDEYTSHGHCGIVREGKILNDETLDCLRAMATTHAQAGADMVAPSDMMDGRVAAIRDELDRAGFVDIPIMAYAAKFASCFYAPFRDAAHSSPQFGDRQSYQMDPANKREALREIDLDIEEGADIIMVKPAMPYLDVISAARERTLLPIAAYQVSGEYSMIKAAAQAGWLDENRAMLESLLSIKRAGRRDHPDVFCKRGGQAAAVTARMKISRGLTPSTPRPYAAVTIGNFDGHHHGHRALLSQVVETARRKAGTALVLTFDPHPVKILAPHVNLHVFDHAGGEAGPL